jgi:type VI secretion system secreted protein VgrG
MTQFVQGTSPILIDTPFGADKLMVKRFHGEETISGLFQFTLEMISESNSLSFAEIMGKKVTLTLQLEGGGKQYLNGVVGRFMQAGKDARFTTYFAEVHPWLWFLKMNSDCRIFQNMTTPDIVKKVFSDLGFTDFKDSLTATYHPREYCVQYMETSFDFVSRLMEEEGIFYFFTHASGAHTLVLADGGDAYETLNGADTVTVRPYDSHWTSEYTVGECTLEQQVTVGQYKADDFNFELPGTDLLSVAEATDTARSVYEYPGLFLKKDAGEQVSKLRLESFEAAQKLLRGSSPCRAFRPGYKFTLKGHSREDANAGYVVTRVTHQGDQSTAYSNEFEAILDSVPFRPRRVTPRPRIYGTQTATVTGKEGEEIWTDKYGRIKVQFHWDQVGTNDENSSCWIRVAQGWAGKQWGAIILPRIGQEVVVSFLEGNPDRPLVTGCVYNATQTVPYALPDEQTKSTLKSNSSKGGSGFNEIRFEDKAGSEEIFMQAQKDMKVDVLNDQTLTVKNNRTTSVRMNDKLTVLAGDRTIKVDEGKETHEVKGTREVTVTGNETHTNKADYTAKVSGNFTLKVSGNISIEASGTVSIKSGTSFTNQAGTSLTNKSGTDLTNQAGTSLTNKAGTTMENNAAISLTNKASASQTVDGGGMLNLKGGLVKIN